MAEEQLPPPPEKKPEPWRKVVRIVIIVLLLIVIWYFGRISACGFLAYQGINKADDLREQGKVREAIAIGERIKNYPGRYRGEVRERLALWYAELGQELDLKNQNKDAIQCFEKSLEYRENPGVLRQLAGVGILSKEWDKVVKACDRLLAIDPKDADAKKKRDLAEKMIKNPPAPAGEEPRAGQPPAKKNETKKE